MRSSLAVCVSGQASSLKRHQAPLGSLGKTHDSLHLPSLPEDWWWAVRVPAHLTPCPHRYKTPSLGHGDTRTRGHKDTRTQGHEDTGTLGHEDTRTHTLGVADVWNLPGAVGGGEGAEDRSGAAHTHTHTHTH